MLKIPTADRRWIRRSCGTTDMATAKDMARIIEFLDEKAQAYDVLDRMSAKEPTLTLTELRAHWRKTPQRVVKGSPIDPSDGERLGYVRGVLSGVNLVDLVALWAATPGLSGKYEDQVRALVPEKMAAPTDYTPQNIKKHIVSLGVSVSTQRKYRAACASFGNFLVDSLVLDVNPAHSISLPRVTPHDPIHHTEDEAKRLIASLPVDQAALEALMAGSGMEWQACGRLTAADFDIPRRMVFAKGGKTKWRRRWVEVTEDWCWEYVMRHLRSLAPRARFVTKGHRCAHRMHEKRVADLGITETTMHQWRHYFTVLWIERGALGGLREDKRNESWLKNQLGHSPRSVLVHTTYGVTIHAFALQAQQDERLAHLAKPNAPSLLTAMK